MPLYKGKQYQYLHLSFSKIIKLMLNPPKCFQMVYFEDKIPFTFYFEKQCVKFSICFLCIINNSIFLIDANSVLYWISHGIQFPIFNFQFLHIFSIIFFFENGHNIQMLSDKSFIHTYNLC